MVLHNESILLSGGVNIFQKCLQFDNGTWKQHSTFNRERADHSVVTTQTATFVFGGRIHTKLMNIFLKMAPDGSWEKLKSQEAFGMDVPLLSNQEKRFG